MSQLLLYAVELRVNFTMHMSGSTRHSLFAMLLSIEFSGELCSFMCGAPIFTTYKCTRQRAT
jgi:hypothetical protein